MTQRIVVERLRLRVDGVDAATAQRLGEDVARLLAARLAARPPALAPGALRIRVPSTAGAAEIARRVDGGLR